MSFQPGQTVLHYRLTEKIGQGGMGEVWKAVDTTLDRSVAIKVLPEAFATDRERLTRFEREAKVLASLQHSGIAAIFSFHELDGVRFLAMELVPGEDLSQRLARGPMEMDEALGLARQIAAALEVAHENGIVHRDLKPANVLVTPDGQAKVLDFGLAKAFGSDDAASSPNLSMSPTLASPATLTGVILGTASYMSPEQARGGQVDRRADIWAFGVLVHEMLTGKRLFDGGTVSDTLAAVLRADVDMAALPSSTPPSVRRLLDRCLDRNPSSRLRDIGEARVCLESPEEETSATETAPAPTRRGPWIAAAVLALLAGLLAGRAIFAPTPPPRMNLEFEITANGGRLQNGSLALSPDGRHLVFQVRLPSGKNELWLRALDSMETRPLPGTQDATRPFWSPDSKEIAFFTNGELRKIALDGTAPRLITTAPTAGGGTWNRDGVILYGDTSGPIRRVEATGGTPQEVTTKASDEDCHVWPIFLPDGENFIFLADAGTDESHKLCLTDLQGSELTVLKTAVRSSLGYDPEDGVLLVEQNQLVATPLDLTARRLGDASRLLIDGVFPLGSQHAAAFTASSNDILAFQTSNGQLELVKMDFKGETLWAFERPGRFANPSLSPSGRFVAFELTDQADETLVWLHDLDRGVRTPISKKSFHADSSAWSVDGQWIYFDANPTKKWVVYRNSVHGGGEPELVGDASGIVPGGIVETAVDECSADGRWLLTHSHLVDGSWDIHLLPLDTDLPFAEREWVSWANSSADEREGSFSPDSEWIAYVSNASGVNEVYVSPVAGGAIANRWQISTNGGSQPRWSPDGEHLYYLSSNDMLQAVSIATRGESIEAGVPTPLFEILPPPLSYIRNAYDVLPDGTGFIVTRAVERSAAGVTVRVGWRGTAKP